MYEHMRMPFGKHRGKLLKDLPNGYLRWLLEECDIDYPLRNALESEADRRREHDERDDEQQTTTALTHPGVSAWRSNWKRIIFLAHPDRGGDEELCKLLVGVNDAMEGRT